MKKIVRLTESDLLRLVKRVITEEETNLSQDLLNKFKNEVLVLQKELNNFINVINEMIKISKYANVQVSFKLQGAMLYPSEVDTKSKDLHSFLVKYLTDITELKSFIEKILKYSFDITKQKKLDESSNLIKGKRFISEQSEHPLKKYLPMVENFIKSCDRFDKFFRDNFYNPNFNCPQEISQGLYDLNKLIFQFRTYSGARDLSEILKNVIK